MSRTSRRGPRTSRRGPLNALRPFVKPGVEFNDRIQFIANVSTVKGKVRITNPAQIRVVRRRARGSM